jgi:hypothetical protein
MLDRAAKEQHHMSRRLITSAFSICAIALLVGCGSGSSSQSTTTTEASSAPGESPTPAMQPIGNTPVVITFDQVAIASGAGALRLDMELKNTSKDPVQCDPSEFTAQLGAASPIDADTSAAVSCDPDSIDPDTTGKATMFFDVPGDYKGPVSVTLTVDGKVVGSGTTQIH